MNLKSIFLGIFCLFVTSSFLSAQISTGISIGVLQSNLKSDLFQQEKAGLGYRAGFDFSIPVGKRFEVMPSIAYASKGAEAQATAYQPEQGLSLSSFAYEYQSFQSQMLLAIQPVKGLRVQVGGYLDAMSNRIKNEDSPIYVGDFTNSYEQPITAAKLSEAFSGLDYGPVVGISVGQSRFRLTAQYMHGMANLYKYTSPNATGHSLKAKTFSVAATYFFMQ